MPRYLVERSFDTARPEAVRRAAGRNRQPIDLVTEVSVLDPYPYDRQPTS